MYRICLCGNNVGWYITNVCKAKNQMHRLQCNAEKRHRCMSKEMNQFTILCSENLTRRRLKYKGAKPLKSTPKQQEAKNQQL
jgi:hypothetical protein